MKSRIVYQGYVEKKITPTKYVPPRSTSSYDYGRSVATGEPAYFKLTNDIVIKEIIVDAYFINDGVIEIPGDELSRETVIPLIRVLIIEPYDGPRTEPVEKGLRAS